MSFETKFIIAMAIIWPLIGLIYLALKVYIKKINAIEKGINGDED